MRIKNWLGPLLGCATLALYLPACRNDFVNFDDPIYVTKNAQVAAGLTADSITYAWTTFDSANWIPLTWLSYELDATLFGVNATAFHATNVLIHALNVWLLFLVLRGMTGHDGRSALVALLFAIHPLHVESVAWVSERKDVLSTLGLLLTLLAYCDYAARPNAFRYAFVCAAFIGGLLAKSMLVTLPILLLLVDYWPLQRILWNEERDEAAENWDDPRRPVLQLIAEKIPLLAIAFLCGLVTLTAQTRALMPLKALPVSYRMAHTVSSYGWYLEKTFCPSDLCVLYFYYQPDLYASLGSLVFALLSLVAITLYVAYWSARRPHLVFGWLWFLISLLPVIGLVQVGSQVYADRYAYVPHIGLFVMLVWEGFHWAANSAVRQRIGWGITVALVAMFLWKTTTQISTWRDSDALWTNALQVDPFNPVAHLLLGDDYFDQDRLTLAQEHYESVFVRQPADARAIMQLARIHERSREWDLAAAYYAWMLRIRPDHELAAESLIKLPNRDSNAKSRPTGLAVEKTREGLKAAQRGEIAFARTQFLEATVLDPEYELAWTSAALACEELGDSPAALRCYEQAVRINPFNVEARHGQGRIVKLTAPHPGTPGR